MRLIIIRHAIAVPHGAPGYADEDRPLTPEGEARFREAARGLARAYDRPDALLTSPWLRARQTAEIAGAAWKIEPKETKALAGGTFEQQAAVLDRFPPTPRSRSSATSRTSPSSCRASSERSVPSVSSSRRAAPPSSSCRVPSPRVARSPPTCRRRSSASSERADASSGPRTRLWRRARGSGLAASVPDLREHKSVARRTCDPPSLPATACGRATVACVPSIPRSPPRLRGRGTRARRARTAPRRPRAPT